MTAPLVLVAVRPVQPHSVSKLYVGPPQHARLTWPHSRASHEPKQVHGIAQHCLQRGFYHGVVYGPDRLNFVREGIANLQSLNIPQIHRRCRGNEFVLPRPCKEPADRGHEFAIDVRAGV